MAQTGYSVLSLYYSATAAAAPTAGNLVAGELAINTNDGVLYYKDSSGVVQSIASKATTAGTFSSITTNQLTIGTTQLGAGNASIMKNRIINGAMVIDQRNAGASVTPTNGQYTLDRWQAIATQASKFNSQQNAGSVTPPVGFKNYLGITSNSAYSITSTDTFLIQQGIEGLNTYDLGWGTANAKTITISFWVQSSLTGTFGGAIGNNANNRSYPFSYTISTASTWEYKTITIAGDTTGTWATDNSIGLAVRFSLGTGSTFSNTAGAWAAGSYFAPTGAVSVVGTNGATFYITGVQLEVGSSATGYEYRLYNQELSACQRYYVKQYAFTAYGNGVSSIQASVSLPVSMRATPTMSSTGVLTVTDGAANYSQSSTSITIYQGNENGLSFGAGNFTGVLATFRPVINNGATNSITLSAEL